MKTLSCFDYVSFQVLALPSYHQLSLGEYSLAIRRHGKYRGHIQSHPRNSISCSLGELSNPITGKSIFCFKVFRRLRIPPRRTRPHLVDLCLKVGPYLSLYSIQRALLPETSSVQLVRVNQVPAKPCTPSKKTPSKLFSPLATKNEDQ